MKLEKAIELLQELKRGIDTDELLDHPEAIQLGLEALKREEANRKNPDFVMVGKLPGETPADDSP